ncbi:MAG: DUF2177 family protein [Pseudomonadota bacterium]
MEVLTLFAATAVIFLILDAIALNLLIAPLFRKHLGEAILPIPRVLPAAVFYLFYVAGLLVLISWPAYQDGDAMRALWQGALLGAMAYGTYEFTNYATLADWKPSMVVTDGLWGTALTALSASGGVIATQFILA